MVWIPGVHPRAVQFSCTTLQCRIIPEFGSGHPWTSRITQITLMKGPVRPCLDPGSFTEETDLSCLSAPLLPLPDNLLLPVPGSHSTSPVCRPPRRPPASVVSSPRDFSQEGPFDTYCSPSDTGSHPLISEGLSGCPYRMVSYSAENTADADSSYGAQLHHPLFLDSIGAPESARLLGRAPSNWVRVMSRQDTMSAALQLHYAGLMVSNLQVLRQYVTSLNRVSTEVMRLAFGPELFPSEKVDAQALVPRVHRTAQQMSAMGLWCPPLGPGVPRPMPVSSHNDCLSGACCLPENPTI